MTSPLLVATEMRKAYGGVVALDNVSIDVQPGSITGLIGPNGSGKSTLLDCISGFTRPDTGQVALGGTNITRLPAHKRAHAGLVRTFQNVRLYEDISIVDHLLLAAQEFDGVGWAGVFVGTRRARDAERRATERAHELLELVGLAQFEGRPAEALSFGQRKLLMLAQSLMSDPELILLDEPLAGVSPPMVETLRSAIIRLNDAKHAFLIVEHNVEFVRETCEWIVALDRGSKLTEGTADEVWRNQRLLDAFLGELL
jgi:ABC-type branched-subunit amino acid transport system ATPase component